MSAPTDKEGHGPSSGEPKHQPGFAKTCRAKAMGNIAEFAVCLVPPPQNCGHVFSYGHGYYCHHPQRQEIVARTLQTGENRST